MYIAPESPRWLFSKGRWAFQKGKIVFWPFLKVFKFSSQCTLIVLQCTEQILPHVIEFFTELITMTVLKKDAKIWPKMLPAKEKLSLLSNLKSEE